MTSNDRTGPSSPSVSSNILPLGHQRRSSVISVASNMNREALNQALDTIHRAASCTDSLTTFNEFAAPPSASGREGLGIAGDIQGSLSGLYSKIKATVGGSKEGLVERRTSHADGADDTASLRSIRTNGSTPASQSKLVSSRKRNLSPAVSNISSGVDTLDSGEVVVNAGAGGTAKVERGKELIHGKTSSVASNNTTSNEKTLSSKTAAALRPFTASAIGPGGPTVAETNVTAAKAQSDRKSLPADVSITPDGSDNRLDAVGILRAADQRVSRNKVPEEQSQRPGSASKSELSPSDEHYRDLETPKAVALEKSLSIEKQKLQPVTPPEKIVLHQTPGYPQSQVSPDQNTPKSHSQAKRPFLGIVRGHSATSTSLSTASTSRYVEDHADEALNVVGRLPSNLQSKFRNSRNAHASAAMSSGVKNKVLSKEYWMRDENAKDCFFCGDPFTTWRRKHHCRTCGQIFDAKCTTLVSGEPFGQSSSVRVCKPCEGIINGTDDSSEFSDDASISSGLRPRHGSSSANDISPARSFASLRANADMRGDQTPTMAIPGRRIADDNKRRSAVLEFDADPRLQRPGSSRSLKPSLLMRAHASGHKRHHSKQLLQRGPKIEIEEAAPFHTRSTDSPKPAHRLSAFHSDSVIDPDLAAYLSDEDSDENEQVSLADALSNDNLSRSADNEKSGLHGLSASSRRRSRFLDKSFSIITSNSKDAETASISSTRLGRSRSLKRRAQSISSNMYLKGSPIVQRHTVPSQPGAMPQYETSSIGGFDRFDPQLRIDKMEAHPTISSWDSQEGLESTSINHIKRMLSQLLKSSRLSNVSGWEKALLPIILQASNDVTPDVQNGDAIDIRHYIKLKKIPGGRTNDSALVSGLVFTKNLALKSMPRSIPFPNILILTFPLEYARHQRHFMSLEPVIRQEREFLYNLVSRIAALKPNLLLVHRNISGLALQFLEEAQVATAYNVKLSVLEAISRCAQTRIITSIDKLAVKPVQAGRCAAFYLKTYKHKDRKKTYMYLSGCPKELGCTIVLRGGDEKILARVKKITEFMTYVAYNLKLECSFIKDELARPPTYQESGTILPDQESRKRGESNSDLRSSGMSNREGGQVNGREQPFESKDTPDSQGSENHSQSEKPDSSNQLNANQIDNADEINLPDDTPMPTFYSDMIDRQKNRILSCSPFVKFKQPYLVMRAREQERRLMYFKQLRDQDSHNVDNGSENGPEKFMLVTPDMMHETTEHAPKKVREVVKAVQDAAYDKAVHNYRTQKKQWETYVAGSGDMFDPLSHQNIAILYTVLCVETNIPCSGPDVLALGFYNEHETDESFDSDVTLGQYVEDLCIGASKKCSCNREMFVHHRQYVHGEAQLSVTVEKQPSKLKGYEEIILMWSVCRICNKETPAVPMSDSTWKYSFGKYLELSFWGHNLHGQLEGCSHDLHREYHRLFGFRKVAVRIAYEPINLLEVIVPRTRITWKVTNDLKFKNEAFQRVEERINRFMISVKSRIKSIRLDSVIPEKAETCKEEVDRLTKLSQEHHTFLIEKLQEKYMGSEYYEIVPFNRAIRALQERVVEWDSSFAEFDRDFFPSDKDIRRLATLQLKKIFLDRDDSVTSLSSNDDKQTPSMASSILTEQSSPEETPLLIPQTRKMSLEKAEDMLTSVVENNISTPLPENGHMKTPVTALRIDEGQEESEQEGSPNTKDVQHLDLAVPEDVLSRTVSQQVESPDAIHQGQTSPTSQPLSYASSQTSPVQDHLFKTEEGQKGTLIPPEEARDDRTSNSQQIPLNERSPVSPRVPDGSRRKSIQRSSIPLYRAQSQPAHLRRDKSSSSSSGYGNGVANLVSPAAKVEDTTKHHERKPSGRLPLGPIKSGVNSHSMIPRSIASRRKESKVSTLAKHFEELSREFERERLRDRKQRASRVRQARAYPVAASRPIIEEYRNFHEAVAEKDPSDEQVMGIIEAHEPGLAPQIAQAMARPAGEIASPEFLGEGDTTAEETAGETTENEELNTAESRAESEDENERKSMVDKPEAEAEPNVSETQSILTPVEAQLDLKIDLPKHEKSSLMKMLTNFWAERSASGWQPLEYPLNPTDHIFADSDIIVREDEPSSLIAFALGAEDYKTKLAKIQEESANYELQDRQYVEDLFLSNEDQMHIERSLLQSTGTHLKYQFQEGSAKMMCKIFYAEQFEAVRRKCGIDFRFIESLSRCMKWDSKGGKTKSVFLKTNDDRLVLKSLSQIETQAFLRFAPSYFTLMGEALFHDLPSVIAKMVGFYQVIIKNPATGTEFNWFLLVMENLFYDRNPNRIFDLKGSMRNRRIQSTGEQNEVLLDENMVDYIYERPLFAREHSKRLLRASVYNDTLFLSRQNVMDYSLMVAIDEQRKELVVGIIDCIRTYTWDKKLESWMKDRGKNRPTVTSPKEYKNRFREAMSRYVLQAPTYVILPTLLNVEILLYTDLICSCWHQFKASRFESPFDRPDDVNAAREELVGELETT